MTLTTHTLSTATVIVSGLAGGKLATVATQTLEMPEWLRIFTGPMGALGAALIAVRWLVVRLDKSESKFADRDVERDRQFEQLISLTVQNQKVIEQNSDILREVKNRIS